MQNLFEKFVKNIEKTLAISKTILYTFKCCGMIALKREVATGYQ